MKSPRMFGFFVFLAVVGVGLAFSASIAGRAKNARDENCCATDASKSADHDAQCSMMSDGKTRGPETLHDNTDSNVSSDQHDFYTQDAGKCPHLSGKGSEKAL